MIRQFNFIIEGKLITVMDKDVESARKQAYEVFEECKRAFSKKE